MVANNAAARGWEPKAPERVLQALRADLDRFQEACLAKLRENLGQELTAHHGRGTAEMREWYEARETFVRNICADMGVRIQDACAPMLDVAAKVTLGRRTPAEAAQHRIQHRLDARTQPRQEQGYGHRY